MVLGLPFRHSRSITASQPAKLRSGHPVQQEAGEGDEVQARRHSGHRSQSRARRRKWATQVQEGTGELAYVDEGYTGDAAEDEAAANRAVERQLAHEAAERAAGLPQPPPFDVAAHQAIVAEIRATLAAYGIVVHDGHEHDH